MPISRVPPDRRRRRCPTGKVGYRHQRAAQNALNVIDDVSFGDGRRPVRAYLCPQCDRWHLTSWPAPGQPPT